jgi:hypothetical protein
VNRTQRLANQIAQAQQKKPLSPQHSKNLNTTIENQLREINQVVAQGNMSTLCYTQGVKNSNKQLGQFYRVGMGAEEAKKKSQKNLMRMSAANKVYQSYQNRPLDKSLEMAQGQMRSLNPNGLSFQQAQNN